MLTALAWLCVIPPSLSLLYFSAEVLAGLRPLSRRALDSRAPVVAVIIPAHDEAALIIGTVQQIRDRVADTSRVIVVADNCSDDTAGLARSARAEVIERQDPARRGKGFALSFARDYLSTSPPDAVFVLDADCRVDHGSVEDMATIALSLNAPVQATNLLRAQPNASALVLLSNFAMLVKNGVRARGLYRIGGGCTLLGTGVAFPWSVFARIRLATSDPVEDLSLALGLARQGTKVHLYDDLLVTSDAADIGDSLGQRTRWEHGFLGHACRFGLPFLAKGMVKRSRHRMAIGMHLLVPPLALLFVIGVISLGAVTALAIAGSSVWPAGCLLCAMVIATIAIALAWIVRGRSTIPFLALVLAPLYILWKLPLYGGFLFARQTEWNRTRRANEQP